MSDFDEQMLLAFIEESQEHLDGIENDLLSIEASGADIDEELVNQVFRAVHSIKGGAGFLGLDRITELAHGMENVLNKVRNREFVLDDASTSVLLEAADVLSRMIEDTGSSNERDIDTELVALEKILDPNSAVAEEVVREDNPAVGQEVVDTGGLPLVVDPQIVADALETLNYLYLVEYGAEVDAELELANLEMAGTVLAHEQRGAILFALFASIADPDIVATLIEVEEEQVRAIDPDELAVEGGSVEESVEGPALEESEPVVDATVDDVQGFDDDGELLAHDEAVDAESDGAELLATVNSESLPPEALMALNTEGEQASVSSGDFMAQAYVDLDRMDRGFAAIKTDPNNSAPLTDLLEATRHMRSQCEEKSLSNLPALLRAGEMLLEDLCAARGPVRDVALAALLDMASVAGEVFASLEATGHEGHHDMEALVTTLGQERLTNAPEALLAAGEVSPPAKKKAPVGATKKAPLQKDSKPSGTHDSAKKGETSPPAAVALSPMKPPAVETSLRVHVSLLDRLMNLAGELVLTRNQLKQVVASQDPASVERATQRLDQVTTEMQETVVSTRMQPVGNVFGKFRRIVRDLSRDLGKQVELRLEGEEVELDKSLVEALNDPLTHLVRNALDHGIEKTEERRASGKELPATLWLRALHEAGQVVIEVVDDGKGMDAERLREKALNSGQFDPVQLRSMSDRDIVRLIFQPGFSTAEKVSDISGRGVGMDVVHTNLTRLGGVVDIDTEVGCGTTIRIKLPLTLAIIPSLLIEVDQQRFAIPQANLAELVRVPVAQIAQRIQRVGQAQVLRLRGRLLPLVGLRQVLGERVAAVGENGTVHVLVLKAGEFKYGMVVDELLDSEEIVVKPLDNYLSSCGIYAGATILGDGQVAMILDVVGISDLMELAEVEAPASQSAAGEEEERASDVQSLLLLRNSPAEQLAVPASLISRVERVSRAQIEDTGGRVSMQYRGGHLPLFTLDQAAPVEKLQDVEYLSVVVFPVAGREAGLLVWELVDIVAYRADISVQGFARPGLLGSAIIDGQTTLVVDLYGMVREVEPAWVAEYEDRLRSAAECTVLIAEDTAFFRQQLQRFMTESGYRTIVVEDGAHALAELERCGGEIDLLLTDIEMPIMDGLELTRRVRADANLKAMPIIAVTSLVGEENVRQGKEAGVDEYLVKMDRERILQAASHYLTERSAP